MGTLDAPDICHNLTHLKRLKSIVEISAVTGPADSLPAGCEI